VSRLSTLLLALLLGACAATPNPNPRAAEPQRPMNSVDLDRYLGRWYVIANIPYFAERGRVGAYAEYSRREDGRFNDWYFARKGNFSAPIEKTAGLAWVPDPAEPARWKVRFYWPFTADYLILHVDPDYRYAVIGHPTREYAWIFAREPRIPAQRYEELLAVLDAQGYDRSRLLRVPQFPDQLGAPGYQ
jgi:apolipoprotein D and lipocalin family protein